MFFEGFGVDHVHSKLSPMHGTAALNEWKPIESRQTKFFAQYEGYLSSHDCERGDDEKLAALAKRIRHAAAKQPFLYLTCVDIFKYLQVWGQ